MLPHVFTQWEVSLSTPFPTPGTTILVVDDERISRRVAYRLLSEQGYRVLEADGGQEALDVLRLANGRIDLVLMDVVMPGLDGVAVAQKISEQWPDLKLLYMSANPAEILFRHGLTTWIVPFLAKPYTLDELLRKVHEALDRRGMQRSRKTQEEPLDL
ncbi:MAG: response regulator [Gemmatimonadota bacterium]